MIAMLLIMTAASLGMLIWVNAIIRKNGKPTFGALAVCICLSGLPLSCGMFYLLLLIQGLFFAFTIHIAYIPKRGPKIYCITSTVITLALWIGVIINYRQTESQYQAWRDMVPFESIEQRLPVLQQQPEQAPSTKTNAESELTALLDRELSLSYWRNYRARGLEALHIDSLRMFHNAAGFGGFRMIRFDPKEEHFLPDLTGPIPQPEPYDPNAVSLGEDVPDELRKPFVQLHADSLIDYVNPNGFGYVKSRSEVSGFQPHRFSKVPGPVEHWQVRRVELISLLLNPTPKVYITENLPRMADVKQLPTRNLDSFESDGLRTIRDGRDLYSRGDDINARMIGAIRSVEQCLECHGGKRGDLLGAFTYQLRRDTK